MGYVMMAVPAELVAAVSEFIEGEGGGDAARVANSEDRSGFVHGWDHETVRRAYRESGNKMRELLEFLARHPGEEVSSYDLADAVRARYGWNTVAGMLGAFGRRSSNRYGRSKPMWEVRYDEDGRVLLTLPEGAAGAIQEAKSPESFNK
ncbi:MAG TPA: hypothetical protein VHR18_09260 [Solirubrobacterales bacterium]|jgi:hypothetical protein|nr:hypothetical protein [Solirubrobacterales bacterium]